MYITPILFALVIPDDTEQVEDSCTDSVDVTDTSQG